MQRKKPTTPASTPSTPPPFDRASKQWVRSDPPSGELPQGPSLVNYELELKVDFPLEMVLEM
jgi:hypothetical protein